MKNRKTKPRGAGSESGLSFLARKTGSRLNALPVKKQRWVVIGFFVCCFLLISLNLFRGVNTTRQHARTPLDSPVISPLELPATDLESDSLIKEFISNTNSHDE